METSLITQIWILFDVVVASFLTGLVGMERESGHKPAGFRTNTIIGGSSALLISLGGVLVIQFENSVSQNLNTDPIRIIEAIILGISFIGAGTILKQESKSTVLYLTTASTLLFSAGIGISVGLKQYYLAIGLTLVIIIINRIFKFFEGRFYNK